MTPLTRRTPARRRLVGVPLAAGGAALALVLTACSGGGDDVSGEPSTPSEPVELRMTVWTADETQLRSSRRSPTRTSREPDLVRRDVRDHPVRGLHDVPHDAARGRQRADLAGSSRATRPSSCERRARDVARSSETEGTVRRPARLVARAVGEGRRPYAYPFSNSPFALFVNTDQVAAAGQPNPADLVASAMDYDQAANRGRRATSGKQGSWCATSTTSLGEPVDVWDGWARAVERGRHAVHVHRPRWSTRSRGPRRDVRRQGLPGRHDADFFAGDSA
nr:hypothetical protein [Cellulosimicrobium sp. MM]